jgi:hypothetical protein
MLARAQARSAIVVITALTAAAAPALAATAAAADPAPAGLAPAAATSPAQPVAPAGPLAPAAPVAPAARIASVTSIASVTPAGPVAPAALAARAAPVASAGPVAPAGRAVRAVRPVRPVRPVRFAGYTFQLPRSWPVIRLARHPRACVRFDRSVAYLGTPGPDEACPAGLVGATQSILIEPASAGSTPSSVQNPVARQITVRAPRVSITATYGTDQAQIDQILRSAALPEPTVRQPDPTAGPAASPGAIPLLPASVTNFHGLGFDACAIPSAAYMRAWRRHSRYRAVGVFIGGSELACAQPNLSRRWLRQQASAGWHFMPLYVGPQALFGQLKRPGREGTAAAADAVTQARRLGFRRHTPLYYDMEGFGPGQAAVALRFLLAWTTRLHQLGYASGIYSSALSGVGDLAAHYWCDRRAMPDVVFYGRWNGRRTTADPIFHRGQWLHHHRLHQYSGNVFLRFGGRTLQVDQDYLNVDLRYPQHSARLGSGSQAGPGAAPRHHCWVGL